MQMFVWVLWRVSGDKEKVDAECGLLWKGGTEVLMVTASL